MYKINIPYGAQEIINELQKNSYDAYVVGGCVRDSLLGISPHDWDICTSATPDEVIRILSAYELIPTGLKHGTITALVKDGAVAEYDRYEITTFRKDGDKAGPGLLDLYQTAIDIKIRSLYNGPPNEKRRKRRDPSGISQERE